MTQNDSNHVCIQSRSPSLGLVKNKSMADSAPGLTRPTFSIECQKNLADLLCRVTSLKANLHCFLKMPEAQPLRFGRRIRFFISFCVDASRTPQYTRLGKQLETVKYHKINSKNRCREKEDRERERERGGGGGA